VQDQAADVIKRELFQRNDLGHSVSAISPYVVQFFPCKIRDPMMSERLPARWKILLCSSASNPARERKHSIFFGHGVAEQQFASELWPVTNSRPFAAFVADCAPTVAPLRKISKLKAISIKLSRTP
jgi:hypothetical protein